MPTNKRTQSSVVRVHYQNENHSHQPSVFVSSSHNQFDSASYAKPAEIYVYARKRPLLANEIKFRDTILVPDSKNMLIEEHKSNLDCTPLLKKVLCLWFSLLSKSKICLLNRVNFNLIKSFLLKYQINKYSNVQFCHFYHPILVTI